VFCAQKYSFTQKIDSTRKVINKAFKWKKLMRIFKGIGHNLQKVFYTRGGRD
jgi:hypothetical protein